MKISSSLLIISLAVFATVSCKDKKEEEEVPFDKAALLENVSSNIITPALDDFETKIISLQSSYGVFKNNRTAGNLSLVRSDLIDVFLAWQHVKPFDLGPIRDYGLKAATNTYPCDTAKVLTNIDNGGYTLGSAGNIDAVGLSTLDFLLFRSSSLDFFVNNEDYTTYAEQVINKIQSEVTAVKTVWNNYKSTFVASTGTESTSAFSMLVNEFNRDYELAKNAKLGIPIGKQSLGVALPEYIEARYSGVSLELLDESVSALFELYKGKSGVGFDDYLNHLEKGTLNNEIQSKFNAILSQASVFTVTLEEAISSNPSDLDLLYLLMSEQVVKLKTEMTSSFGVLITYQDNDGD